MAVKSKRKQIRESLERQLMEKLALEAAEAIPPELKDQLEGYLRLFDRRRELQGLLTNASVPRAADGRGRDVNHPDYVAVGSKLWLEASKEDRQLATEMRRVLDFLGLKPPDSSGAGGGVNIEL